MNEPLNSHRKQNSMISQKQQEHQKKSNGIVQNGMRQKPNETMKKIYQPNKQYQKQQGNSQQLQKNDIPQQRQMSKTQNLSSDSKKQNQRKLSHNSQQKVEERRRSRSRDKKKSHTYLGKFPKDEIQLKKQRQAALEQKQLLEDQVNQSQKQQNKKQQLQDQQQEQELAEQEEEQEDNQQDDIAKIMGFSSFQTSKNKDHTNSAVQGVRKNNAVKRQYRQYMNRRGGMDRKLDKI